MIAEYSNESMTSGGLGQNRISANMIASVEVVMVQLESEDIRGGGKGMW